MLGTVQRRIGDGTILAGHSKRIANLEPVQLEINEYTAVETFFTPFDRFPGWYSYRNFDQRPCPPPGCDC
jgi:hypothetical protein